MRLFIFTMTGYGGGRGGYEDRGGGAEDRSTGKYEATEAIEYMNECGCAFKRVVTKSDQDSSIKYFI